ncbi:MAG: glycosyltransferase, partial [Anaerolineales bacterium]
MRDALLIPLATVYLLLLGALFAYGLNFFYLTWRALLRARPDPAAPALHEWPSVTVQLPIYNELYVAERLIAAAAQLDYAPGRLEIQVLDDSTDETFRLVRAAVARWQARGVNVVHLPRKDRTGYKAGALAYGLSQARGEFIAIFDADFIPPADFLRCTVPHFQNRPRLAFVQTRWGHVNAPDSLLTRVQALAIDAHFAIEQGARSA